MLPTLGFLAIVVLALISLSSRIATRAKKRFQGLRRDTESSKKESNASPGDLARVVTPAAPAAADISSRSKKNISWFLEKHGRQISRIKATNPRIDLMTAENWLMRGVLVELYKNHLQNNVSSKSLSYADGLGGDPDLLLEASRFFNHFFKSRIPVRPEHIVVGAGCSAILENLLHDICEPGDGIMIEVPFWGGFETSFVLRAAVVAVHVVQVSLTSPSDVFIAAYEEALMSSKRKIKAVILCNPQNPRCEVYPREHIEALLCFCEKHNLHFISDEIYGMSEINLGRTDFLALPFLSVLEIDLQMLDVNPARVHMIYSISKDLGSSGLRLGFIVTQQSDLRLSLAIANHSKVSTLTSTTMTAVLSNQDILEGIFRNNKLRLSTWAKIVVGFLDFHSLEYTRPVAGVYIWARLKGPECTWNEESELNDRLEHAGVSLGAGKSYCARQPGWFRVTFAVPRPVLYEALRRIENALGAKKQWKPEDTKLVLSKESI
ncbi:hypothetical protein BP6252_07497 [Coleophoma cylindrospora]|uniref:Aminotransferase class I/classII large domain-containing protein n=1 Tax=Coleophoma cylindrospora TaxID=1849047 RepID=A0A3D8RAN9_9HELO|nr:hypothetical protein BP6252_07497 [Coleophoma cylindrospora]